MKPSIKQRWLMASAIVLLLTVVPYIYYRATYAHAKRFRVVSDGILYRSGCMTAQGFRDAIVSQGIRTVINLMDESPEPDLPESYFSRQMANEAELCRELGTNFVFISLDMVTRAEIGKKRPVAIDQFLKVMDDPANHPVLIHCRAGLHRTGCMVAVYRMEYDGWTINQAMDELRDHGFGTHNSTSFNPYITQYVLSYRPGFRRDITEDGKAGRFHHASQSIHDPGQWNARMPNGTPENTPDNKKSD